MQEHLSWNLDFVREAYLELGSAVWQFQGLEDTLAKLIVLTYHVGPSTAHDDAITMLETLKLATFGGLLTKLGSHATLPDDLAQRLDNFRVERNWVVHHSYGQVIEDISDRDRCTSNVERIRAAGMEAFALNSSFWDVLASMSTEYETGASGLYSVTEKLRDEWRGTPNQ